MWLEHRFQITHVTGRIILIDGVELEPDTGLVVKVG